MTPALVALIVLQTLTVTVWLCTDNSYRVLARWMLLTWAGFTLGALIGGAIT